MKKISPGQYAISVCAAAAMLAGCGGGSTSPSYQPSGTSQTTRAQNVSSAFAVHDASCQGQQSFHFTGKSRSFTVPMCATTVYVDAIGAPGDGGYGGEVSATIPVTPGETLIVTVGGAGHNPKGGFNGGAAGTPNKNGKPIGGGGGGASDVRQDGNTLANRVVVAGGGGGAFIGHTKPICRHCQVLAADGAGGSGGGLPDGGSGGTPYCIVGTPIGGGGGTQSSGGSGGAGSNGGSLGNGGLGVSACFYFNGQEGTTYYSGGGGGGYYGGGGGGDGGAGGGGSGYAEPTATNVSSQNGVNSGNGSVHICWGYSDGECGSG